MAGEAEIYYYYYFSIGLSRKPVIVHFLVSSVGCNDLKISYRSKNQHRPKCLPLHDLRGECILWQCIKSEYIFCYLNCCRFLGVPGEVHLLLHIAKLTLKRCKPVSTICCYEL